MIQDLFTGDLVERGHALLREVIEKTADVIGISRSRIFAEASLQRDIV